jgi:hypothetical protein
MGNFFSRAVNRAADDGNFHEKFLNGVKYCHIMPKYCLKPDLPQ